MHSPIHYRTLIAQSHCHVSTDEFTQIGTAALGDTCARSNPRRVRPSKAPALKLVGQPEMLPNIGAYTSHAYLQVTLPADQPLLVLHTQSSCLAKQTFLSTVV